MKRDKNDIQKRIHQLQRKILAFDVVCTGSLQVRKAPCGKSNCRCQKNKKWHHGPYYDWTRLKQKRLVHSLLTQAQAKIVKRAIENYRTVRRLLRTWEAETIKLLDT